MNSCSSLLSASLRASRCYEPAPIFPIALLIFFFALTGCTVVRVQGADATVSHSYLGIANVLITPAQGQSTLVVTEGLGAVGGPRSATLGWMKETLVLTSDLSQCRAYIVVQTDEQRKNLQRSLSAQKDICMLTTESNLWKFEQ